MTPAINKVDYYFSVASPWTYFGNERFKVLAQKINLDVEFRPVDLARLFSVSGGMVYQKRSVQRRQYRQVELERWSRFLEIPITLEPAYYPVDRTLASLLMIFAQHLPVQKRFDLLQSILRAIWYDNLDISDPQVLARLVATQEVESTLIDYQQDEYYALWDSYTEDAINVGVFGVPTYVYKGELFWGQDRLEFLERALAD